MAAPFAVVVLCFLLGQGAVDFVPSSSVGREGGVDETGPTTATSSRLASSTLAATGASSASVQLERGSAADSPTYHVESRIGWLFGLPRDGAWTVRTLPTEEDLVLVLEQRAFLGEPGRGSARAPLFDLATVAATNAPGMVAATRNAIRGLTGPGRGVGGERTLSDGYSVGKWARRGRVPQRRPQPGVRLGP